MIKSKQLSETSQAIARYLIENGTNPFTEENIQQEGGPNHYEVKKELPDGRTLRVYFCDVNKAGSENPMPNSRLEVTLKPVRDDQFGYQTMEYGLNGEFQKFRILTGIADNMPDGWFHFNRRDLPDGYTIDHIQEKYDRVMKEVYTALSGK